MAKRSVLAVTESPRTIDFITAYFSNTQSIPTVIRRKGDLIGLLQTNPGLLFFQSDWLTERFANRLQKLKEQSPKMKSFALGHPPIKTFPWDDEIEFPLEERGFQRKVLSQIDFPERIKLVVVDDEPDIREMIQDYFEVRKKPVFEIRTASNGLEGFKLMEAEGADCLILDIKMPVRSGAELYRDLARSGKAVPTIIFIDSTNADEVLEIQKWGNPAFVEKGGSHSSMPEMLGLVKKLVAFC